MSFFAMPGQITEDDGRYALSLVETVCADIGPGMPCTPQERQRAAFFMAEMAKYLSPENVRQEEFVAAPWAFVGALPVSAVLLLLAVLLNLWAPVMMDLLAAAAVVTAMTLAGLSALTLVLQFILYQERIDGLFRHKQSVNVIGRLCKPDCRKVERLLILSGHHDSAPENTWIATLGYAMYATLPTIFLAMLTMIVLSAIQLIGVIVDQADIIHAGRLGWVLLAYPIGPAIVFGLFFNRGRRNGGTVPGAADNLSACAAVLAVCRFLVRNPDCIPENTEVRFITFGCEEAGLRGSRRYVARHLDELKQLDARLLNYEVIAHPEIGIITTDVSGVKQSPKMIDSVVAAAQRAGVPYIVKPNPTGAGGSDAGPFGQAGLKALTLMPFRLPQQLVAFYHQKRDTPEVLTIDPFMNVLKLTIEWIQAGGESNA